MIFFFIDCNTFAPYYYTTSIFVYRYSYTCSITSIHRETWIQYSDLSFT